VANQVVTALCDTAWTVRCQVGAELARSLGGSGELAKMQSSPRVQLDFLLQFAQDEGYDPPQGSVQLVRPSTRFSQSGFWKARMIPVPKTGLGSFRPKLLGNARIV